MLARRRVTLHYFTFVNSLNRMFEINLWLCSAAATRSWAHGAHQEEVWNLFALSQHFWSHCGQVHWDTNCSTVPWISVTYSYSVLNSSSCTSCIGLSSVASPQIWLIHLFLGRPILLFPVGLYYIKYHTRRLWSVRVIWLHLLRI